MEIENDEKLFHFLFQIVGVKLPNNVKFKLITFALNKISQFYSLSEIIFALNLL